MPLREGLKNVLFLVVNHESQAHTALILITVIEIEFVDFPSALFHSNWSYHKTYQQGYTHHVGSSYRIGHQHPHQGEWYSPQGSAHRGWTIVWGALCGRNGKRCQGAHFEEEDWWRHGEVNSMQILTGMVMKYHVSVDCQESYIFPKRTVLRENIVMKEYIHVTILTPPTHDISSVPVNICYIRLSKWMI